MATERKEPAQKRPGGRPSKYLPQHCETLIAEMAEGASLYEVAATIGVCMATLENWFNTHLEFLEAKKRGEHLSRAWWERKGRLNLENGKFNHGLWYMNMKNRFGWRDNIAQEHTVKIISPLDIIKGAGK